MEFDLKKGFKKAHINPIFWNHDKSMKEYIMRERQLHIDGMSIRIHKWGNSTHPMIICFHGLGSTSLSFIEIANLLKDDYYIIAIDLPGHGKTTEFSKLEDYESPKMIQFIDHIISHLTDHSFFLLAHSWGADVALHYLVQHPSKVEKTLLLDGGYYLKNDTYEFEAVHGVVLIPFRMKSSIT